MTANIRAAGHTGTVAFDGAMLTIERTGLLARAAVGKGTKQIPIGSVVAVQYKPAGRLVNGFIEFTISGAIERGSHFGQSTSDAGRNENAVVFRWSQRAEFGALRDAVTAELAERMRR